MSIVGIGADIIKVERIATLWLRYYFRFASKILTKDEIFELKKINNQHRSVMFLAKRFGIKESIVKALGLGFRKNLFLTQIGVTKDGFGKPSIVYYKKTKTYIKSIGNIKTHISLSDDANIALTFVIVEK